MGVLIKTRTLSNQRLDLIAYENIESFICTDFSQLLRNIISNNSYIIDGLRIYQDINTTNDNPSSSPIYVKIAGSMILHTDESNPYGSFFAGANSIEPAQIVLVDNATNFIEAELTTSTGSPDTKTFYDPSAGGGVGEEYTQIVDTVTNLNLNITTNTSGFSGSPKLRLAQITMVGGSITEILDKRDLFFTLRRTNPNLPQYMYTWPNGINEPNQDRKIDSNAFIGADKSIQDQKSWMDAVMTEIYRIKFGDTPSSDEYWFSKNKISLKDIASQRDGVMYSTGTFTWNLSLKRIIATSQIIILYPESVGSPINTIQSSAWATVDDLSNDGDIYFIDLEPENDGAFLSLTKSTVSTYIKQNNRVIITKRIGNDVLLSPLGVDLLKLSNGETSELRSELTQQIIQFIGAANPADNTPPYTVLPSGSLSYQFTQSDSLVTAISANTGNINDIVNEIQKVYREPMDVVTTAPIDDNEIQTNDTDSLGKDIISSGTNITLPLDSRNGNLQKQYLVGNGALLFVLNGQIQILNKSYSEVGTPGTLSSQIQIINDDLYEGDNLEFIMLTPEVFGGSLGVQPYFVNYITGQTSTIVGVGSIYNVGTDKLSVWRNGLFIHKSSTIGGQDTRYTEFSSNSIELGLIASSSEVFAFVNHVDPQPAITILSSQIGSVLTVPTYIVGSKRLRVYRNGLLMSTDSSSPSDLKYTESSTTTITLDIAASGPEIFVIWYDGSIPTFREDLIGVTGTVLTIPNGQTYSIGDERLLVFRNGILMFNSLILGNQSDRYQETSTTTITLETPATSIELFTFLRISV